MERNTEFIARFVSELTFEKIPREVIERTGGTPECTVWGTKLRTSAPQAAFANGIFCHATDYNDMWLNGAKRLNDLNV